MCGCIPDRVMKIKDGFMLRKVGSETVVVATGAASVGFNGIIRLNDTGEFLWGLLEQDTTEEAMAAAMLEEYDIDETTAKKDIAAFVGRLKEADLLA